MNYNKINPKAVQSWIIGRTIFSIIFGAMYFVGIYKFAMPKWGHIAIVKNGGTILTIAIIILLLVHTFIFPIIEYKEWKYKIYEDKIELINGIITRKKIIIPISRIQHLDIEQGPINRKFGLAVMQINTAGITHEIPAITNEEAESISEKLKDIIEMSGRVE